MGAFTTWLISEGIPLEILQLLIMVSILVSLLTFSRYVVGFKTVGIYMTALIALSFFYLGIPLGMYLLAVILLSTFISYSILKRSRMHYIARVSTTYSVIAILTIISLIAASNYVNLNMLGSTIVLPIVSLTLLSDFVIKQSIKASFYKMLKPFIESLIIVIISVTLIKIDFISTFLTNNLWIIPLLGVFCFLIGKYVGLRVFELVRFNQIKKDAERDSSDK